MRYFTLLIFIICPFISHSLTITSTNLNIKASNFKSSENLLEIWASTTGTCTPGSDANGNNTCNSCSGTGSDPSKPCNPKKIDINSTLVFNFTYDKSIISPDGVFKNGDIDVTPITENSNSESFTIGVTWNTICQSMNSDNGCNAIGSDEFTLGVEDSANGDNSDTITVKVYSIPLDDTLVSPACDGSNGTYNFGIKDFSAFPGDEKIFFPGEQDSDRISPVLTFCDPSTGVGDSGNAPDGGETVSLVAFYNTTRLSDVNYSSDNQVISFVGTFPGSVDISEPFIDGLDNETPVFVRLAVQDEAGNIFDLSPDDTEIVAPCAGIDNTKTDLEIINCKYSTFPLEVLGLLNDDVNCFIATATFGSNMHFLVKDLREFRNKILLKSKMGKWFVQKYYAWGSQASHFLIKYPSLKFFSKLLLFPLWIFALLSLKIGFLVTLALSAMTPLFISSYFIKLRRTSRWI